QDFKLLWGLYRIFRETKADLVCNITVKPIIYGSLAARLARVSKVVGMIEGLGYSFAKPGTVIEKITGRFVSKLYRLGCSLCDHVGFANPEDLREFVSKGLIPERKVVPFRSMIGVDLREYTPAISHSDEVAALRAQWGIQQPTRVIVMVVARAVWSKGVRE